MDWLFLVLESLIVLLERCVCWCWEYLTDWNWACLLTCICLQSAEVWWESQNQKQINFEIGFLQNKSLPMQKNMSNLVSFMFLEKSSLWITKVLFASILRMSRIESFQSGYEPWEENANQTKQLTSRNRARKFFFAFTIQKNSSIKVLAGQAPPERRNSDGFPLNLPL